MLSVTTQIEQKGDARKVLERLIKEFKRPPMVKVGFPQGKTPAAIINVAFWNHEGTHRLKGDVFFRNGKFGISGPIPPRPFITVAFFRGRSAIRVELRNSAAKIMRGEMTMEQALMRVGILGQNLIQAQISAGMGPPNSPMTIYLKGSSKPLVDTGKMRGAVTWEIDR
jgi:hypothetical protein